MSSIGQEFSRQPADLVECLIEARRANMLAGRESKQILSRELFKPVWKRKSLLSSSRGKRVRRSPDFHAPSSLRVGALSKLASLVRGGNERRSLEDDDLNYHRDQNHHLLRGKDNNNNNKN